MEFTHGFFLYSIATADCVSCGPRVSMPSPPPRSPAAHPAPYPPPNMCSNPCFDTSILLCTFSTDCVDCGVRTASPPPPPHSPTMACMNNCFNAGGGSSSDDGGGQGSEFTTCAYVTDCIGCGPRIFMPPPPPRSPAVHPAHNPPPNMCSKCFDSLNTNCLNAVSCPYLSTAVGGTGLYLNPAGKSTTDLRAILHHAACTGADRNSTTADGLRKDARKVFEIAHEKLFSKIGDANVTYSFPYDQTNASEDTAGDPMEKAANLNGVSSQWVECADLAPVLLRLALLIWAVCSTRRRSGPNERFANQTHRNQRFALALLVLLVPRMSAVATTAPSNGDGTGEHLAESAQATPRLQPLRPLPLTQLCADDVSSGALDSSGAPMPCSYFSAQPSACASYSVARTTCPVACDTCSPLQPGPSGSMVFSGAVTSDHPVAGLQHAPSHTRAQQAQQASGIPSLTSTPSTPSTPSTSAGSSLVTGPPFQRPPLPPLSVSSPPMSLLPSSPLPPLSAPTPLPPRPQPQLPLPRPPPSHPTSMPPTSMPPSMPPPTPSLGPPNSGPTPPWSSSPPPSPERLWLPLILPPPPVRVPSPPPQWSALMAPPPLPCTGLPCTEASDNDAPGLHSMQFVPSHRRELQTSVSTVADLTNALANTAVGRIVLASGTYYLSAELSITRSVVIEAAAGATVTLDAQASSWSPRRVLYIAPGSSGVVQLIGLSITGGYVDTGACSSDCMPRCCGGGGVLIHGGSVALSSCTITGNTFQGGKGGGVYVTQDSRTVTLSSCTITGNMAGQFGGGLSIATSATSSVTLSSCTITGNSVALYGGGVCIEGSGTVTLSSCIITDNSAYVPGNANNGGGGVAVFTSGGTVAISSSNISGNVVGNADSVRAHAQTSPWP